MVLGVELLNNMPTVEARLTGRERFQFSTTNGTKVRAQGVVLTVLRFSNGRRVNLQSLHLLPLLCPLARLPTLNKDRRPSVPAMFPIRVVRRPPRRSTIEDHVLRANGTSSVIGRLIRRSTLYLPINRVMVHARKGLRVVRFNTPPSNNALMNGLSRANLNANRPRLQGKRFTPRMIIIRAPGPLFRPFCYCGRNNGNATFYSWGGGGSLGANSG